MTNNVITFRDKEYQGFSVTYYPDGQPIVCVDIDSLNIKKPVNVECSLKTWDDFLILKCIYESLLANDIILNKLYLNYIFGARSDRRFAKGECNFVSSIILPFIKSLDEFKKVIIFFPHSGYRFYKDDNMVPISYNSTITEVLENKFKNPENLTIVSADKSFGEISGMRFFEKVRRDGNIEIGMREEFFNEIKDKPIMVFDVLCDVGKTFIEVAKFLKKKGWDNELYLMVYHGLFTKGLDELLEHYHHIFTTNSYCNLEHPKLTVIDIFGGK